MSDLLKCNLCGTEFNSGQYHSCKKVEIPSKNIGWICPICTKGIAPFVSVCPSCGVKDDRK